MVKEKTPKNAPPWMDGAWTCHFFPLGSCSTTNLFIVKGLKVGAIQLDGLKTRIRLFMGVGVTPVGKN